MPGEETPTTPVVEPVAPVVQPTQAELDLLPAAPDWAKDWTPDDRKSWAAKGALDPNGLWKSYTSLEKAMSSTHRVTLPKEGDAESLKAFNKAIGVPETADKYEIDVPEKYGDAEFGKAFAGAAHAAGLTPTQVKSLNTWWNEQAKTAIEAAEKDQSTGFEQKKAAATASLQKELGAQYQTTFNLADRTASALGFTAAELLAIENTIGTEALIKRFASVGGRIGEKNLVNPTDTKSDANLSKDEAKEFISEIRRDEKKFAEISRSIRNKEDTPSVRKWFAAHTVIGNG